MADENTQAQAGETGDAGATETAQTPEELARELAVARKRGNDAHATLRKRDATIANLTKRLDDLEQRTSRQTDAASNGAAAGDDPEPDIDANPTGWLKWSKRQEARERLVERQRQEIDALNNFGMTSESIARQQSPDYDQAMEFLRQDYRKELEKTGELDEAAFALMNDANQRQNILNWAAQNGMSEAEAARDMCARGAWEWRRQRIVAAQRRLGGNPAIKALELAKDRGYKPGTALTNSQGNQGTTGVVDDALKELERKKNLRAAGQTTADVRDGGEAREKRAWTYDQLMELQKRDPKEWRRVTSEIARDADSDPSILGDVIKH